MKTLFISAMFLIQTILLFSQNNFRRLPFKYNSFINKTDISWACEMFTTHEFSELPNKEFDIHSFLRNAQRRGKIKSYLTKGYEDYFLKKWSSGWSDDYYIEVSKSINNETENLYDSTNAIEFCEIFYLENYQLKSQVICAAAQLKFITPSGIYVGNSFTSYSSLNYYTNKTNDSHDEIIFLGNTYSILNFDSIESRGSLKRNYNLSLPLSLWYGLSNGFNKVIDLKTSTTISPPNILSYSTFDSVEYTQIIDSIEPRKYKVAGATAFSYFSDIGIQQSWYYNKTKDIFFAEINKAYLYMHYMDQKSLLYVNERRFEITFTGQYIENGR